MKYLIYKGTGGLVHMLNGLQSSVELSKKENRTLIIDTNRTTSFRKSFNKYFFIYDKELNYFSDYESIVDDLYFENIDIFEIENRGTKLIDGKYYLSNSDICIQNLSGMKNKIVRVYAGYSNKFIQNLRLKNELLYEIFDYTFSFIKQHNQYISVHFRNTDMKNSIDSFIQKIKESSEKYNIKNIFIATDDYQAFEKFSLELPELTFFKVCETPDCNGKNIHYHFDDTDTLIKNTLKDLYMIVKSKYFIPSINSGISKWIIHQQNNKDDSLFDDDYDFTVI